MWHTDEVDPSEYPDQKISRHLGMAASGGSRSKSRKQQLPGHQGKKRGGAMPTWLIVRYSIPQGSRPELISFCSWENWRAPVQSQPGRGILISVQCNKMNIVFSCRGVSFRETLTATKKSWIDWQTHLQQKQRPQRTWAPWSWAVREKQDEETRNPGALQATRQWHYHPWKLLGILYGISRQVKLCDRGKHEALYADMDRVQSWRLRVEVLHTLMNHGLMNFFQVYLHPCLVGVQTSSVIRALIYEPQEMRPHPQRRIYLPTKLAF